MCGEAVINFPPGQSCVFDIHILHFSTLFLARFSFASVLGLSGAFSDDARSRSGKGLQAMAPSNCLQTSFYRFFFFFFPLFRKQRVQGETSLEEGLRSLILSGTQMLFGIFPLFP